MPEPDLVLMDEPFAGVHPELKQALLEAIRIANEGKGTSFLIVSHEMPVVAALCQWLYAMHLGRNYLEGPPEQVVNDERLVDIYLGDGEEVGRAGTG
jgi:branched-chain amino acid transport system ATP-binding protein